MARPNKELEYCLRMRLEALVVGLVGLVGPLFPESVGICTGAQVAHMGCSSHQPDSMSANEIKMELKLNNFYQLNSLITRTTQNTTVTVMCTDSTRSIYSESLRGENGHIPGCCIHAERAAMEVQLIKIDQSVNSPTKLWRTNCERSQWNSRANISLKGQFHQTVVLIIHFVNTVELAALGHHGLHWEWEPSFKNGNSISFNYSENQTISFSRIFFKFYLFFIKFN